MTHQTNSNLIPNAPILVDTKTLAKKRRMSESYWYKRRLVGDGPPFMKIGRAVLYDLNEVDAWLARRKRMSTTDPGAPPSGGPPGVNQPVGGSG